VYTRGAMVRVGDGRERQGDGARSTAGPKSETPIRVSNLARRTALAPGPSGWTSQLRAFARRPNPRMLIPDPG